MKKIFILMLIVVVAIVTTAVIVTQNDNVTEAATKNRNNDFVVQEEKPVVETSFFSITKEEREMLAKIVTLESSICSIDTQKDVCSVIFNRLESGKWKKDMNGDGKITLYDIIYYPCAFSPVLEGKMDGCIPTDTAYAAVDYVVKHGPTLPTYVRYFRSDRHFTEWYDEGYIGYHNRDNMYFGYFKGWEQGQW